MNSKAQKFMENRHKFAAKVANGKILDIGFAENPNTFLTGQVVGLDLKRVSKPKNYSKCIFADFNHLNVKLGERFDTVTALEFLEHIDNPIEFFRKVNKFLNLNGLLVISTPTPYYYKTMLGNLFFPRGYSRIVNHKHIFAPRILNNIAKQEGFELVEIKNATSIIPFINWQLIYVYRKIK